MFGPNYSPPYFFNLSYSVGDKKENIKQNRKLFFSELGLNEKMVAFQKQVHGDFIREVERAGMSGESDGLITLSKNLALAISSADCSAIFIYDPVKKIIAAVHSGWRSKEKKILQKTLLRLKEKFNSKASDMVCYIGPSVSQKNYEVGNEVAQKFDKEFVVKIKDKFFLDVAGANYKMLVDEGVKFQNIQLSKLCSFEYSSLLHSYRRDGQNSGRSLGIIMMKENL